MYMLKLTNIVKRYDVGANQVEALKGISIEFRPSEFVAILGHSGCGKTTMLNIIGGLDRYSSGDLVIRGRSTKQYKSRDWDTYRNHSVGFVFQSYNLIPHQSVLANVELALTLSGVKRAERRRRAADALKEVGLGDQLHKRPNQLSGGQMQRVAIARALVNDPEILLADEPTGALDSETSVQVMELLKEISRNRLVIMVTHNPELADKYATRIVRLHDGSIVSDSDPYSADAKPVPSPMDKKKQASMSGATAFMLSLSNLMTKKGRTLMTAFAGSIGIVGIALILSISSGINQYITDVEKDTLANYPLTLQANTVDMSSMMTAMNPAADPQPQKDGTIYSTNIMSGMMDMMLTSSKTNNLAAFKKHIESGTSGLEAFTSEIRYTYSTPLNVYKADTSDGIFRVNPSSVFSEVGVNAPGGMAASNSDVWMQLTANQDLLQAQYQVLEGRLPETWDEVILILNENDQISDYTLYSLGVLDLAPLQDALQQKLSGKEAHIDASVKEYAYEDFMGMTFKLVPTTDYYVEEGGRWVNHADDPVYMTTLLEHAETLRIVGIVKPQGDTSAGTAYGTVGYTGELMERLITQVNEADVVKQQRSNPETDILMGLPFADPEAEAVSYTLDEIYQMLAAMDTQKQMEYGMAIRQMQSAGISDEQIASALSQQLAGNYSHSSVEDNLHTLGVSKQQIHQIHQ